MTLDNEKPDGSGIMSMDDAIRIIQSHERARQGRLRAKQIRELRLNDQRARQRANMGESKMDKSLAATIIQKYYRRHVVRRETKKFRDEEYMFLGMVIFVLSIIVFSIEAVSKLILNIIEWSKTPLIT